MCFYRFLGEFYLRLSFYTVPSQFHLWRSAAPKKQLLCVRQLNQWRQQFFKGATHSKKIINSILRISSTVLNIIRGLHLQCGLDQFVHVKPNCQNDLLHENRSVIRKATISRWTFDPLIMCSALEWKALFWVLVFIAYWSSSRGQNGDDEMAKQRDIQPTSSIVSIPPLC